MTTDEPTRRRDGVAVTDEAIERIKSMIVSGELQPGDRLPKEDKLAAELGLSRSSLPEAAHALALVRCPLPPIGRGSGAA